MSADRWSYCPRCTDLLVDAKVYAINEANKLYGTITIEEFDDLRRKANAMPVQTEHETFREDYECYADNGTLYIDYRGRCSECGLTATHKHEEVFYPASD